MRPEELREDTGKFKLIFADLTFGTEALSAHSECLRELEPEPAVFMHTRAAESLGIIDGQMVAIQTANGSFEAKLRVAENMAASVLIVPRHRKMSWQIFETGISHIDREQIKY